MNNQSAIEYDLRRVVEKYTDLDREDIKDMLLEICNALQEYSAGDILEYITKE